MFSAPFLTARIRASYAAAFIAGLSLASAAYPQQSPSPAALAASGTASGAPPSEGLSGAVSSVLFIANRGQFEQGTEFFAFTHQLKAWLGGNEIVFAHNEDRVEMMFPGSRKRPFLEGAGPLAAQVNYLRGGVAPVRNAPAFEGVIYRQLYDGVDLLVASEGGTLKTEFTVQPGTDHRVIRVRYRGAHRVEVDELGALVVHAANGYFREHPPVVYQDFPEGRRYLAASYFPQGDDTAGFLVEDYDRQTPLVIDPLLTYGTYFGGSRPDTGTSLAVDASGAMYVAGFSESANIPTQGPIQSQAGSYDAFVFKLNAAGTQLSYATFIGGSNDDRAYSIAVDTSGAAYLCGSTASANFPTQNAAPIQPARGGGKDGFVLKLAPAGNALVYSSYIGGSGSDAIYSCVLDAYNQVYATGETNSTNLPTKTPFQAANAGGYDAMVLKISLNNSLAFSTYFGGSGDDSGRGIAIHATQLTPYLTGYTSSTNLPVKFPAQPVSGGGQDAFVARFNSDANNLVFSTYLGGSGGTAVLPEQGLAIAVDTFGNNYVTGVTSSQNFPLTLPYQNVNKGGLDAFFAKHDNGGVRIYSSYLGGSGSDIGTAITADINRRIYVAGYTSSVNFPTLLPAQSAIGGSYDAFVTQVDVNGSPLFFSSYLGGSGPDLAYGLALNGAGEIHLAGSTNSSNFPTQSAYRFTQAGSLDMFLAKLSAAPVPPSPPVYLSLAPNSGSGISPVFTLRYTDSNGANTFDSIQFMVNSVLAGANSCQVAYVHSTGLVYLLNNGATAWTGGLPPGALNTLSNSQCAVPLASMAVSVTGNDITLTIPLSFATTTYHGTKNIYALALDTSGLRSDWAIRGTWTLP